ncbi:hypothetical protein NE237_012279 [Protea cynaroides]|uniref:Uncharacterized protein n=1 Tax=Protea cynaroides TaxID=273540 RepID=A0A9Q0GYU0_9MAGN|nr:hypothetical protein NE237_012279 [Protea cynaroides]
MFPSSLRYLGATNIVGKVPNLSNLKHPRKLDLLPCEKLNEIEGLEGLESVNTIKLDASVNLKSIAKERMFQVISKDVQNPNIRDKYLPGTNIRKRFDIQFKTLSASCQINSGGIIWSFLGGTSYSVILGSPLSPLISRKLKGGLRGSVMDKLELMFAHFMWSGPGLERSTSFLWMQIVARTGGWLEDKRIKDMNVSAKLLKICSWVWRKVLK